MFVSLAQYRTIFTVIGLGILLLLSGCIPSSNPDVYGNQGAGTRASVQQGVIVDVRTVKLQGSGGLGAPVGAAAGGIGGSFLGSSTRTNLLGALGGAVVGGITGYYVDKTLTTRDANQYIIRLSNGKNIAVVQGKTPALSNGQHVLVLIDKSKTRVIPDDGSTSATISTKTTKK